MVSALLTFSENWPTLMMGCSVQTTSWLKRTHGKIISDALKIFISVLSNIAVLGCVVNTFLENEKFPISLCLLWLISKSESVDNECGFKLWRLSTLWMLIWPFCFHSDALMLSSAIVSVGCPPALAVSLLCCWYKSAWISAVGIS